MAEQIARPHPARQKRVERVLREDVCSFPAGPVSELSSLPADALAHTISTASPREFVVMEEFVVRIFVPCGNAGIAAMLLLETAGTRRGR